MNRRTVFFVSDQTGVTAETMGHSLLTQFDGLEFRQVTLPFIATPDKAEEAVRKINATGAADGLRPIVFSTLVKDELRDVVKRSNGLFLDFFRRIPGSAGSGAHGQVERARGSRAWHRRPARLHDPHRCDELRVGRRRRRGDRGLRPRGRDPDRRVAVGQDPHLHLHGHAVRGLCRQLSIHGGRFRIETIALDGPRPTRRSCSGLRSRRRDCSRSATSGVRAAAMRRSRNANSRCAAPRTCCTGTASRSSTRPSPRSRKSRAASSTARASSAGSVPSGIGAPRRVSSVAWFTVAPKPCAIVER